MVLEEARWKRNKCVLVLSLTLDGWDCINYMPPGRENNKSTAPTEVRPSLPPPIVLPTRTMQNNEDIRQPTTNDNDDNEIRDDDVVAFSYSKAFEEASSKGRFYGVSSGLSEEEGELVVQLCREKLKNKGTSGATCMQVFVLFVY
jgi:hypothetical protein